MSLSEALFLGHTQQLTLVVILHVCVVFRASPQVFTEPLVSVDHDTELIGVHQDSVFNDLLVITFHLTVYEPLMYFEPPEVARIGVYSEE